MEQGPMRASAPPFNRVGRNPPASCIPLLSDCLKGPGAVTDDAIPIARSIPRVAQCEPARGEPAPPRFEQQAGEGQEPAGARRAQSRPVASLDGGGSLAIEPPRRFGRDEAGS